MSAIGLFILAVSVYVFVVLRRRRRLPLPPGPPSWPIIGSALEMPTKRPWLKYTEWCKTCGEYLEISLSRRVLTFTSDSDVVFVNVLSQPAVILGSVEAATDLLERRSQIYSDRPQTVMGEL